MHLGSDYDFECTLQELSDNGATFEGKIEWNGDWVLKFMVPLDLSGPETQGLHSSLQTKKKVILYMYACHTMPTRESLVKSEGIQIRI